MSVMNPSCDFHHLETSVTLPLLSPTVTPSHEDSDPYHELSLRPSQPPTEIDLGTARLREIKSCKLNIFNDNNDFLSAVLNTMDSPVQIDILRLPITDTKSTSPASRDVLVLHLPPKSSALLRISWSPLSPGDLNMSLLFKCNNEFTSAVAVYGKVEVAPKKSQRVLFGDTQTPLVKQSVFRAPLSTLTLNSPLLDKRMLPPKRHTLITAGPSNTSLDVEDSVLSLPSRSFVASTPMERHATRPLAPLAEPSAIQSLPPRPEAGERSLSFSRLGPGAGSFDTQWADKQTRAFSHWLNFVLAPPDSSNFASLQPDSSPTGQRASINLTYSLSCPPDPPETGCSLTQRKYLYRLRAGMQALYAGAEFAGTLYLLHSEIEKSRLRIRPERPVWKDVGLKEDLLRTLLCYHPLWLRLGVEAVFGCPVPVSHEMDSRMIRKFLNQNLFSSTAISSKFSHRKVPGLFTKGHDQVVSKHILLKYFSLVLLLDIAKDRKLIEHDPCLFNKNSRIKSSREMLLYFSSSFLQGEGDVTKHLGNIGYRVSHKQTFLDQFDYKVQNLAVDLRDGIRLSRLLELLTQDWGLSQKLRVPATSMNPRLANNKLILDKLKGITQFDFNISSRDISIGHKEKTLSLIWVLIFHFRVAIKLDSAMLRKEIAYIRANKRDFHSKHTIRENSFPIKLSGNDGRDQFSTDTLELLLEWSSVICGLFGLRVTDFTSSFADGRALCYILHYYHPALLSRHFICEDPVSNLEEFSSKLSSLGGIPALPPASDFFQTGPNEKVVIMYLAYLCGQQLELSAEIRAATVIQRAYRRHTYRTHQSLLEQSSYDSQLSEFRTQREAAIAIQSVYRGAIARREASRRRESRTRGTAQRLTAVLAIQSVYRGAIARREASRRRESRTRGTAQRLTAVLAIQSVYRGAIARREASRRRESRTRGTAQRLTAVLAIQSWYRGAIARREASRRRESRTRGTAQRLTAVLAIQSVYRGAIARREASRRRESRTRGTAQRLTAVLAIQSCYRKWCSHKLTLSTRRSYLSLKRIVILIQQTHRRRYYAHSVSITANSLLEINRTAVTLQSIYRGSRARRDLAISCECNKDFIQTLSNSTVATALDSASTSLLRERTRSTISIQRCYRKWSSLRLALSVRGNYISLKYIVISVQRAFRRYSLRKRHHSSLVESTAGALVLGSLIRACALINEETAKSAIAIQSLYRGLKARRELKLLSQQENERCIQTYSCCLVRNIIISSSAKLQSQRLTSALTIQRCYNKWSANKLALYDRTNYLFFRRNVISLQRAVRKYLATKKLTLAAITTQSAYRGARARREFALLRQERALLVLSRDIVVGVVCTAVTALSQDTLLSTLAIQQCYRRWAVNRQAAAIRGNYVALKRIVISVQRAFRKRRQDKLKSREQSAVSIQAWWRSSVARNSFISQKQAATRIQRMFRTSPAYLLSRQLEAERSAAITIQSFYRGYYVRRDMQSSLLGIKRRLSDATKSADTCNQLKNKIPKYMDILLNSRSLAHKYDILDNLRTAVYVSESCAIRVRREGLQILYMLIDNHVRSPSIMQRVEKAAAVLLQLTKWPSISTDIFINGHSVPIITNLLQKIHTSQPSTVRVLCHLLIAFCKHPDQLATIHTRHHFSIRKIRKVLVILKRRYFIGANRMLGRARRDLGQSIYELERVLAHFRYVT